MFFSNGTDAGESNITQMKPFNFQSFHAFQVLTFDLIQCVLHIIVRRIDLKQS